MGECFICRRGGGGSRSTLIVTAPTGSTVGIAQTRWENVRYGTEQDGTWKFRGLGVGTWYIHAAKDGQWAETELTITEEDQMMRYNVTLDFTPPWDGSIYNAGNEYSEITGGWVARALKGTSGEYTAVAKAPTVNRQSTQMKITLQDQTNTHVSGMVWTKNAIDLTNYSKIEFVGHSNSDEDFWGSAFVGAEKDIISGAFNLNIAKTERTYSVDVSKLNGSYHVAICLWANDGIIREGYIKKIKLS